AFLDELASLSMLTHLRLDAEYQRAVSLSFLRSMSRLQQLSILCECVDLQTAHHFQACQALEVVQYSFTNLTHSECSLFEHIYQGLCPLVRADTGDRFAL